MNQFVVMGVSGCGKSTVASRLAQATGGLFYDGDDFHPPANVAKMHAGIPLTDDDRWGWLDALHALLVEHKDDTVPLFLACSALKHSYREKIRGDLASVRFIYLQGSRELIAGRLQQRHGHFMPSTLLDSQFATLEEPHDALVVSIDQSVDEIVAEALSKLDPR